MSRGWNPRPITSDDELLERVHACLVNLHDFSTAALEASPAGHLDTLAVIHRETETALDLYKRRDL